MAEQATHEWREIERREERKQGGLDVETGDRKRRREARGLGWALSLRREKKGRKGGLGVVGSKVISIVVSWLLEYSLTLVDVSHPSLVHLHFTIRHDERGFRRAKVVSITLVRAHLQSPQGNKSRMIRARAACLETLFLHCVRGVTFFLVLQLRFRCSDPSYCLLICAHLLVFCLLSDVEEVSSR